MEKGKAAKKGLKIVSGTLLVVVLGLLALELFFRLFIWAWPPVYQSLFDNKNKFYVYMVGESTAEGVQYSDKISPAILVSYQFNDSLQGKPIEIIPITRSGQPLEYHYFHLFTEILLRPHKNALILFYSGINEAMNQIPPTEDLSFWKFCQHSVILSKLYFMYKPYHNCPEKYEYRYHQVINLAKQHGYKIVISQLVGNFMYDPETGTGDGIMNAKNLPQLHFAKRLFNEGDFNGADSIFVGLARKLPAEDAHLLYWIGKCRLEEEKYDSAEAYLSRGPEINIYIGFARWKNAIIERVCKEEQVPVAHVFNRFLDSSEHRILGYNLINDAHHPNLKGYCIMGDELSREVSKLYSENIKKQLTPESVAEHFGFDDEFYSRVYFRLTEWFIFEVCETQEREIRLARLKYYKTKYEQLKPHDEVIILWNMLIAVLSNNQKSFKEIINSPAFHENKDKLLLRLQGAFQDKPGYAQELKNIMSQWEWDNENDNGLSKEFLSQLPRS
jgi:hypothetical protein